MIAWEIAGWVLATAWPAVGIAALAYNQSRREIRVKPLTLVVVLEFVVLALPFVVMLLLLAAWNWAMYTAWGYD